ncbi:MAG: hypothetical protein C4534_06735 [Gaiellales bacterium]|nr:MAG: hypothetical protein C4534_06735 [Gaiellales bacterium]
MNFSYKWLLLIPVLLVAIGLGLLIPRLLSDDTEELGIVSEGSLSAEAEARVAEILAQIEDYEKLLEASPGDVGILMPLAGSYYELAKVEEQYQQTNDSFRHFKSAVDYYRQALELQPENDAIRLSLALSYSGLRMGDVALREIESLSVSDLESLGTNDTSLLIDAGLLYQEEYSRAAEAEILLVKATTLEPENQRAWLSLGFVRRSAGKTSEANAALEKVIAIDPTSDYAQAAQEYLTQAQQ